MLSSPEQPLASAKGGLYTDLAQYYDQFCAEVNYHEQCAFAQRAFACFSRSEGRAYLDLACGTGQHLSYLAQQGFEPSGLDNSAEMLEKALERCPQARLLLCDLAQFEQVAEFDLITCFLYSIHYSHPTTALIETLKRAWTALKPGGVFIFNAVDAGGISNDAGVTTYLRDGANQLSFQSAWHYAGAGEVLDLSLCITQATAQGQQCWHDHHTMTALTIAQLQNMLSDTGFEVTLLEHNYQLMQPWNGSSFNVIVVACKPVENPA